MTWLRTAHAGSCIFLFAACSDHVGVASSAIVGGNADTTSSAIVMLVTSGTTADADCSATVVSPHVLVTAAHCVDPQHLSASLGSSYITRVFVGDDYATEHAGNMHEVATTATAPGYLFSTIFTKGHDVGVVVTKDALDMTPVPYVRAALDDSIVGASVRLVGFGETSVGVDTSIGVRESATTTVGKLGAIDVVTTAALPSACEGDSGGAALVTMNGTETLAGVISHGDAGNTCALSSFADRVDLESAFIDSYVNQYDPGFLRDSAPDAGADASADTPPSAGGCRAAPGAPDASFGALLGLLACVLRAKRQV
jgi:secreted trypsin-like serine protease